MEQMPQLGCKECWTSGKLLNSKVISHKKINVGKTGEELQNWINVQ